MKVDLSKFKCFRDNRRITRLNRLVVLHDELMPHQVAISTGCSLIEAMEILLLLFHKELVEAYLLTYHKYHPEVPERTIPLVEGFPLLPIVCRICEQPITTIDDLTFGFIFRITTPLQFILET